MGSVIGAHRGMIGGTMVVALLGFAAVAGGALKEKSASTTLTAADEFDSVTPKCKRGTAAVAGGFKGNDYEAGVQSQVLVIDSFRAGKRGWTSAGARYLSAGAPSGDFTAYTYCDGSAPRLKTRSSSATIGETGTPDALGSATARCKRGTSAVSGGFDAPSFDGTYSGPVILPLESRRDGKRQWTVSGFNFGEAAGELVAFAYCDKSKPKLKTKSASVTLPGFPDHASATAKCRKASRVVSGGFDSPTFDPSGTESDAYPFVSRRRGKRKWTVAGFPETNSPGEVIVAYAYCEKKR